jgi:hypothetical protein
MKKYLRVALAVIVLASLAPIALASPGGGNPVPPPQSSVSLVIAVILSVLGL